MMPAASGERTMWIQANVSTLRDDVTPLNVELEISSDAMVIHGINGGIKMALIPWVGKSILAKNEVRIWLLGAESSDGLARARVAVGRHTKLTELLDAAAVEILLMAYAPLPGHDRPMDPKAKQGRPKRSWQTRLGDESAEELTALRRASH